MNGAAVMVPLSIVSPPVTSGLRPTASVSPMRESSSSMRNLTNVLVVSSTENSPMLVSTIQVPPVP